MTANETAAVMEDFRVRVHRMPVCLVRLFAGAPACG